MNVNILTYLACICFLFIFGRIFILPIKKVLKLVLNSILGGVTIYIINLIGAGFNFHIGLNIFTSILIRIIRFARYCMSYCCEVINRMIGNPLKQLQIFYMQDLCFAHMLLHFYRLECLIQNELHKKRHYLKDTLVP